MYILSEKAILWFAAVFIGTHSSILLTVRQCKQIACPRHPTGLASADHILPPTALARVSVEFSTEAMASGAGMWCSLRLLLAQQQ